MFKNNIITAIFTLCLILLQSHNASSAVIKEEKIGEYVRQSEFIAYADLIISAIDDKTIKGTINVIEMLKGDLGEKSIAVSIDRSNPNNYKKLKSDLTNLNISASEDIEVTGSSKKKVIIMMNRDGDSYDFLRIVTLFRPDKLEIYLYSYKEIVSMTTITDKEKLLKTIRYNLGEEFSYSLYNHCIDELFKMDIDVASLFSIVKEFLVNKGEKKNHAWFRILKDTGKRFEKSYDKTDEKTRDAFFGYLFESYNGEPLESEYTNKRFFQLLYELRRLILKNPKWQQKFVSAINDRKIVIENLESDHFRNQELDNLHEKVLRSLSK